MLELKHLVALPENATRKNKPNRPAHLTFSDDFYRKESEKSPWYPDFILRITTGQALFFYNEKQANNGGFNTTAGNSICQSKRAGRRPALAHPTKVFQKTFCLL